MKNFATLLAACLVTGCSYPVMSLKAQKPHSTPIEIKSFIDNKFSSFESKMIHFAIDEWNKVLNNEMFIKPIDDYDRTKSFDLEEGFEIVKGESPEFVSDKFGFAFRNRIVIMRYNFRAPYMYGVVLHEIAHVLGVGHTGHGLMKEVFDFKSMDCVDNFSAFNVAKSYNLNFKKMQPCNK